MTMPPRSAMADHRNGPGYLAGECRWRRPPHPLPAGCRRQRRGGVSPARRHASDLAGALAGVYLRPWIQSCGAVAGRPDRRAARPSAQEQTPPRGFRRPSALGRRRLRGQSRPPPITTPLLPLLAALRDGFQIRWCDRRNTRGALTARNGRHPGVGAGGQHQLVVLDHCALVGMHFADPVDFSPLRRAAGGCRACRRNRV